MMRKGEGEAHMQMNRIKRHCLAKGTANLMHTEGGDYIDAGGAFFSCDGLTFTPDTLATIWGLTRKKRFSCMMQEYTPADIGLSEDMVSMVADGEDKAIALVETVATEHGLVRIYASPEGDGYWYTMDEPLKAIEKRKVTEICLRRKDGRAMIVACEGYIVAMLAHADKDSGAYARAVKRRAEKLSAITKDVKGEE